MKKVTKLVLPVAGLGKRLLPLTKRIPKNLILVDGRPILEYALEEARSSGIKEVILIVNPAGVLDFRRYVKGADRKFKDLKFHIRIQDQPAGNGHALLPASDVLGQEPFAVRFCDDILFGNPPVLKSLIEIFEFYRSPVILLERVPGSIIHRFGVVGARPTKRKPPIRDFSPKIYQITRITEKPKPKDAPSNLAIVGGYVLTYNVLRNLEKIAESLPLAAPDAIPLNVGLQIELIIGRRLYGWEFPGKRLDCGTLENLKKTEKFLSSRRRSANLLSSPPWC